MSIYYTGIGARKSGKHTRKQFLDIMNKTFKQTCAEHEKSLKCVSCKKSRAMLSRETRKQFDFQKKNKTDLKTYKISKKIEKKYMKLFNTCKRCKTKNVTLCDFDKYIAFSGAELE